MVMSQSMSVTRMVNLKTLILPDVVPVALDGAVLPEGKIKKCKMRGVESFGMFCGLDTLGLTAHDFPYADRREFSLSRRTASLDRISTRLSALTILPLSLRSPSNRPDCLGVIGLARETAATYNLPLNVKAPEYKGVDGDVNELLKVDIINTEKCKRYCAGIYVKNVKIGPSPRWIEERVSVQAAFVLSITSLISQTM